MSNVASFLPRLIHKHLTQGVPVRVGDYVLVFRLAGQRMPVIEEGETNWDVVSKTGVFQTKINEPANCHLDLVWSFVSASLSDPNLFTLLAHYLPPHKTWQVIPDRATPALINLDECADPDQNTEFTVSSRNISRLPLQPRKVN